MTGDGHCDRLSERHSVLLQARCRKSSWNVFPVELGDISEGGCCVIGSSEEFVIGETVQLRIANLKPLTAHVRWRRGAKVGVEFRSALKGNLIDELGQRYGITICRSPDAPKTLPFTTDRSALAEHD